MKMMWTCLGALALAACNGEQLQLDPSADGGDAAASCNGASDASTPGDGSGYNALTPPACTAADGPAQAITTVSQMAEAVVGMWYDCGAGTILAALAGEVAGSEVSAAAIELTGDGHYTVFQATTSGTYSQPSSGPVTGTYAIVDASAALGPNTFQIHLQPSAGGVYIAQVLVLGSPLKMRFVYSTGPSSEEFAPALNLKFRAGVCSYSQFGPARDFASAAEMAAGIEGTWIWCGLGPVGLSPDPGVGIEFPGDGTWYLLVEDESGNVARGTDGHSHGTLTMDASRIYLEFADTPGEGTAIPVVAGECAPLLAFTLTDPAMSSLPSSNLATFFQRSP